jgi:hypothetical protein
MSIFAKLRTFAVSLISGIKRKQNSDRSYYYLFEGDLCSFRDKPRISVRHFILRVCQEKSISQDSCLKVFSNENGSRMRNITYSTAYLNSNDGDSPFIIEEITIFSLVSDLVDKLIKKAPTIQLDVINGHEFPFVDREESYHEFIETIESRFKYWSASIFDKKYHPIPILDYGPGTGKSRFMQEIPEMVRRALKEMMLDRNFKNQLKTPVFINITFDSIWMYSKDEVKDGIEHAICLRILHQFLKLSSESFDDFKNYCKPLHFKLSDILLALSQKGFSCLFLAFDEVNRVYNVNRNEFDSMFAIIAAHCSFEGLFFVPVFAGTVIGPIRTALAGSNNRSVSIPLPLLTQQSALMIVKESITRINKTRDSKKIPLFVSTSNELKTLVLESSGHCRILELLVLCLQQRNSNCTKAVYWQNVKNKLLNEINNKYDISEAPLAGALCYAFLGITTTESEILPEDKNLNFLDLIQKGFIKLENGLVIIPYLFILCFFKDVSLSKAYFSVFWSELVNSDDTHWPGWERFCHLYFTFRLACFSFLKKNFHRNPRLSSIRSLYDSVSMRVFFKGFLISNDLQGVSLSIPDESAIIQKESQTRFPYTDKTLPPVGTFMLNAAGAPFDAFVVLRTSLHRKTVLCLQMKKIKKGVTNSMILKENAKIKEAAEVFNQNITLFISLFITESEALDSIFLPHCSAALCKIGLQEFFGPNIKKKRLVN